MKTLFSFFVAVISIATVFAQNSPVSDNFSNDLKRSSQLYQENKGQIVDTKGEQHPEILFTTYNRGVRTYFKKDGISYVFEKHNGLTKPGSLDMAQGAQKALNEGVSSEELKSQISNHTVEMHRIDLQLIGSNPSPEIIKENPSDVYDNFYLAHCRIADVRSYGKITYKNVYSSIDMILYTKDGNLKYDFVVHPGGNPADIKFKIDGTDNTSLSESGELMLGSHLGEIIEGKPYSLQNGQEIASNYVLVDDILSFNISNYDKTNTLIIDPTREWGTYYTADGYSEWSFGQDLSADATGVLYVINTSGSAYPVSAGVYDPTFNGNFDLRIAKFDPAGNLLWGTYLGSAGQERQPAISAGAGGNFVLSGETDNAGFPTTAGTQDQTYNGGWDFFLTQFNSTTGALNWSTFFGGSGPDYYGKGVDVNAAGEIAFVGTTQSSNIPMVGSYDATYNGGYDLVVAKFSNSGNLIWSSYFGGGGNEVTHRHDVEFDNVGNIIFLGQNQGGGIPVTAGVFDNTYNGSTDLFLVSINSAGTTLNYSTYIGSASADGIDCMPCSGGEQTWFSMAVCSDNSVIVGAVTWNTISNAWAYTAGAYSNAYGGQFDSYVIKFNNSGNRIWGTTWPGNSHDWILDVAVDGSDNVFVYTGTVSNNLPVTAGAFQSAPIGDWDKHLALLSSNGATLMYGTYLGSNQYDMPEVGTLSFASGSLYAGGVSSFGGFNPAWMTSAGAYQTSATGGAFYPVLNKFLFCDITTSGVITNESCVGSDGAVNLTATTTTEGILTYSWSNGSVTEDISGLTVDTYTVTVTGTTTGCSVNQIFTITNADNVPPVAVCQSFIAQLDATGNVLLNGIDIDGGSTDNCTIASLSASPNILSCANIGANNVTLTVTDGNGNTATCISTVTVEDNVPPVMTCPSTITVNNDPGSCDAVVTFADPTATDNCAAAASSQIFNYSGGEQTFTAPFSGTYTLEVWGAEGGTSYSRSQLAYINGGKGGYSKRDITLTAGQTIYLNIGGEGQTHILDAAGSIAGGYNGGGASVGTNSAGGGGGGGGATHFADASGILSSLSGNQASVLIVAGGGGGAWACDDYQWTDYRDGSDGGAGGGLVGQGGGYGFTMGYTQGNSNNNIFNQNDTRCQAYTYCTGGSQVAGGIQVNSPGPCPFYATAVPSGFGLGASSANAASHSGGGGGGGWYGGGAGASGENANGTGGAGGSSFNNNDPLGDNIAGNAIMPDPSGGTMLGNSGNGLAKISWAVSSPVTTNQTDLTGLTSGDAFPIGTTTLEYTAIDGEGNTSTCTFDVVVTDNEAPTAICQDIDVYLDATGSVTLLATEIDNGSSDACGIATMTLDVTDFDCSNVGANTVTLTVLDLAGNPSTCLSTVTIIDTISSIVTCPADIIVNNVPGNCGRVVNYAAPVINDNCGGVMTQIDGTGLTAGDLFPVGTTVQTYEVIDGSGNTVTCSFNVTVVDNQAPVITSCPSNITVNNTPGLCTAVVSWSQPTASDNCPGVFMSPVPQGPGTAFPLGVTTVTYTAVDASGNTAPCSFTVTVIDNEAPVITNCTPDMIVSNDAGVCGAIVSFAVPSYTENCTMGSEVASQASGTFFPVGTTTVTWTLTDNAGNISTCSFDVTVEDNEMPIATCTDITVQLDATGSYTMADSEIDGGSSDNCGIASITASQTAFDCSHTGANTVTLTIEDIYGNVSTCDATVTVEDNIAPVAICQDITVQLDAAGNATITGTDIDGGSTDACGIASLVASPNTFSCADIGANTVTLTVTDINGNASTCTSTVTIEDNIAPVAVCQNITVQLDAAGMVSITAGDVDNGSSDACGIASMTLDVTDFDCSNVGANTVTLTLTDNNGNVSMCTSTVTVEDNVAPIAVCQDITVQLDASGSYIMTASEIDGGSSDACGIASLVASKLNFDCSSVGPNTVTLTVTDNNGNISTCDATVTVEDNVAPVAVCQDITVQLDASGMVSIIAGDIDSGSSDACGIASTTLDVTNFDCSNVGANTVTLTITDNNGNISTCSSTVTVEDNVAPVAVCQDITVQLDAAGMVSITSGDIDNGSNDACGIASMTLDIADFDCSNVGANTVILTVTDVNGNVSTCTSTVTVEDNIAPVAICQDITVQLDAAGMVSIAAGDVDNGSSDACGIASMTLDVTDFDCLNVGANTVTLTVTDVNGNVSTCTSTVTVEDNVAPLAVCQDITVQLDGTGNASITATDVDGGSSDECGIASLVATPNSFTCAEVGANNVTLTVTDINGNISTCIAIVTVEETTPPVAVCQDIAAQLDATGNVTIAGTDIDGGSTDNCTIVSWTATPNSFTCAEVGVNTVTLTVTDGSGNSATCLANVTVEDNVAPTMICQDITVQLDATGNATIVPADIDGGSTDACGIASLSTDISTFDCTNIGANTITLTAVDVNGNSASCTATVTVEDNVAPIAVCQDITVQLDASGVATITGADVDGGSSDACGISSLTTDVSSFDCSTIGANTVILTVTDNNGNTSTCTSTVTVEDNVAPVAVCQDITVQLDATGMVSITAGDVDNGSSDACGITSMTLDVTDFDCSNVGANTVTLTVTDNNGNVSTCTSTVTVEDNVAPIAVCQDITVQLDASGNITITGADVDGGSSDACGIASFTTDISTFNCSDIGANTVTLTVTDSNGNTSTCTATVTVEDNVAPTAVCQNITVSLDAAGIATIVAADVDGGSSDACGIATMTIDVTDFDCSDLGLNTVTLTLTDVNGNSSTCTSNVTVEDNIAPAAVCQDITVQLDAAGLATITAAEIDGGSTDNCSIANLNASPNTFTCAEVGVNTVTLTVTDVFGNTSTCTANVTVEDNIDPVAVCQNITLQLDATGNATILPSDIDNGSSDACGIASMTLNVTDFDCSNVGTNTVTLTVTDNNGNISTCTSTVTVEDNVAPVALCQNITVQLDATGMYVMTSSEIDGGSTDACGIASITADINTFDCSMVGPNTVTLTVLDVNGNTSTCTATVTVEDTEAPSISCPSDMTVSADPGLCGSNSVVLNSPITNDNCGVATITNDAPAMFPVGTTTVTWTVVDVNGNSSDCIQMVTVEDNELPVIICPADITVSTDPGSCDAILVLNSPVVSDNCATAITNDAPAIFPLGLTSVTWTVTDPSGNSESCVQLVMVEDTEVPTITCPADVTVDTDPGVCVAGNVVLGSPITGDNCGVASVSNDAPFYFQLGTTTVTWTVIDNSGNSTTCTQIVTVEDNEMPYVQCPLDIVENIVTGSCGRVIQYPTPIALDNCAPVFMTQIDGTGYTSGSVFPVGTTVQTYQGIDANGNVFTCTFNITIVDNEFPTLSNCPGNMVAYSTAAQCEVPVFWPTPLASDNCPGTSLTSNYASGANFPVGTTTVVYTAGDQAGNFVSCSFTVTVIDTIAPVGPASMPDVVSSCEVTLTPPTATDNCGGTIMATTTTSFPITTVGITGVVWSFNDGNGNFSSVVQYVDIDGSVNTTVSILDDITLQANNTDANVTYQWIACPLGEPIPGATNQTFQAAINGSYAVVVTEGDCPSDTSFCYTIDNVGLQDLFVYDLVVYPNPSTNGIFNISYEGQIEKIEVVDMIGRYIAVSTANDNKYVDASELASGKYMLRVYTEQGVIAKDVIIINK